MMSTRLSTVFNDVRHRFFVGRDAERRFFRDALREDKPSFHVLYVHGVGGAGKTQLLQEFLIECRDAGLPAHYLDARDLEPSAASFMEALRRVVPVDAGADTLAFPEAGRQVLLVDTFEVLEPLDRWFRTEFLPRLPAGLLVVVAARRPPSPEWRTEMGMPTLVRTVPLAGLTTDESADYLSLRQVPVDRHEAVIRFAHGHPLALALAADAFMQRPGLRFEAAEVPDLIGALLVRFLEVVPSALHRKALEAAALLRAVQEPLLAWMLEEDDVHDLFMWLRRLSFMGAGPHGLFPHDTVREALVADLQWRDPDRHAALHRRARKYYTRQLSHAQDHRFAAILSDYFFLYRDHALLRPFYHELQAQWGNRPDRQGGGADASYHPAIIEMVRRHEGEASAELAAYWLRRQPESLQVFVDGAGDLAGFAMTLALHRVTPEDEARDPAVAAACNHLGAQAPMRAGEAATCFRFWMDREAYQGVSPVQSLFFVHTVHHYLTTPRLSYTYLTCAQPDFWEPLLGLADLHRVQEATFGVGGRSYGMFGHDWRVVPPLTWLDALSEHGAGFSRRTVREANDAPDLIVLSRDEFIDAMKEVLQHFTRPDLLQDSILLRTKMVQRAGAEGVRALQRLVREAAEAMEATPREAKFYRALYHTYLDPEPTQERAAEKLDLPFSTYRRHLRRGLDDLTDALWRRELEA